MPLTLIVTEGVLPKEREQQTIARLSEAFLRLHNLAGNAAMTPNVIGHVQVVPADRSFSGLKASPIAIVEWLTPSLAFSTREVQQAYIAEGTQIVFEACDGKHPKEHIWVHVTHAVDGAWGIAGKAYTNAELGAMLKSA